MGCEHYPVEFRRRALYIFAAGRSITDVARDTDVSSQSMCRRQRTAHVTLQQRSEPLQLAPLIDSDADRFNNGIIKLFWSRIQVEFLHTRRWILTSSKRVPETSPRHDDSCEPSPRDPGHTRVSIKPGAVQPTEVEGDGRIGSRSCTSAAVEARKVWSQVSRVTTSAASSRLSISTTSSHGSPVLAHRSRTSCSPSQ